MIPDMRRLLQRLQKERGETEFASKPVMLVHECQGAIDTACTKLGILRITHHDLRHLFATRCIEPEPRNRNGSARVPRARSGVAPELRRSNQNSGEVEKFVGRNFRRDAENHTPEACATKNLPARLVSISEFR